MPADLSSNYFQLFGLPEQFRIADDELTARYRRLQQSVHPDRFATASAGERRHSLQQAALINQAYEVLKEPLSRARYLLELRGVRWDDERDTMLEPEFLMDQMTRREALAEIRDTPAPLQQVRRLLNQVNDDIEQSNRSLEQSLEDTQDRTFVNARSQVRRLQFLHKLRQEAEELEAELEDMG